MSFCIIEVATVQDDYACICPYTMFSLSTISSLSFLIGIMSSYNGVDEGLLDGGLLLGGLCCFILLFVPQIPQKKPPTSPITKARAATIEITIKYDRQEESPCRN